MANMQTLPIKQYHPNGWREWLAYAAIRIYSNDILQHLRHTLSLLCDPQAYEQESGMRLQEFLTYCYRTVPYYQRVFRESGLYDHGTILPDRLHRVPVLTKELIREHRDELVVNQGPGTYRNRSGGSTGMPIEIIQDRDYYARMVADTLLFALLNGKRPGQCEIKLWGNEQDILEGTRGVKEHIINLLFNRHFCNSFRMSDADMESCLHRINRLRPVQIWTYVDSIYELSRHAIAKSMHMYSPPLITCTAGTLYPELRSTIQHAFPGSRIINQYGSREVGQIACQVNDDPGLFVFRHSNHVELVDPGTWQPIHDPGQPGRLLVTCLNNRSMPLVRYDIGDTAEHAGGTECRYLVKLHGRENTHFLTATGEIVHGEYFTHIFYELDQVSRFQVLQKSTDLIEVLYVTTTGSRLPDPQAELITAKIRAVMGNDMRVVFARRESIAPLQSGKYQFVRREF